MWAVGDGPPSTYSANYPGIVKMELSDYILGPNVTYQVRETQKGQLKKAKVYQQEQLNITWDQIYPSLTMNFLQTEVFSGETNDLLMIYTQDPQNMTYISECRPHH